MSIYLKHFIKRHSFLLGLLGIWWLSLGIVLLVISKGDLVIWFSEQRTPNFDLFFKYATNLGGGACLVPVSITWLFVNRKQAYTILLSIFSTAIIVQSLKRLVFTDMHRPFLYFKKMGITLTLPTNFEAMKHFSFPSGHTAGAFALFVALMLIINKRWATVTGFGLAAIAGISRVYLSQHFLMDVMVGSFIGTLTAITWYLVVKPPKYSLRGR